MELPVIFKRFPGSTESDRIKSARPASTLKWCHPVFGDSSSDVEPDGNDGSVDDGRHQHTPVEAGSVGEEALEAVDGRKAGLGIVEGQELAVHGAPVAARGTILPELGVCGACGELRSEARLCGRIGERVGAPVSWNLLLGHIKERAWLPINEALTSEL